MLKPYDFCVFKIKYTKICTVLCSEPKDTVLK